MRWDRTEPLDGLEHGDHSCLIYASSAERRAITASFLRSGLEGGECCVYLGSPDVLTEMEAELTFGGTDVKAAVDSGNLVFLPWAATYLRDASFVPERMSALLEGMEQEAFAKGFPKLRWAGDMSWALTSPTGLERLIEYEAMVNDRGVNSRTLFMCQYDQQSFDASVLQGVLRTHPVSIVESQVFSNPFYDAPELVLAGRGGPEPIRARVDWWLRQLKQIIALQRDHDRSAGDRRRLSRRLLEVQEAERRHLARELHDEIGQTLTGLRLMLNTSTPLTPDTARNRFAQARVIVDELLEKVRGLSFDLLPAALDQLGLQPALMALFERCSRQTGLLVDFRHLGMDQRLNPAVETSAYRIVQEALTNIVRHAGVAGAVVRIWVACNMLHLQIEDHGKGFDPETGKASMQSGGLAGMMERVRLLEGTVVIEARLGSGTRISAELPLDAATRDVRP